MNLSLKKFDITNITSDKVCVFIGKRETGKSFLVKDLLYYLQDIPIGTVISGTEGANKFYGNISIFFIVNIDVYFLCLYVNKYIIMLYNIYVICVN